MTHCAENFLSSSYCFEIKKAINPKIKKMKAGNTSANKIYKLK